MILIVDRNAGATSGHHAHWFHRLKSSLDTAGLHHQLLVRPPDDELLSNAEWYERATVSSLASDASQLVFTAGDDMILPAIRHMRRIRRSGKAVHLFLFRMARQPKKYGRLMLAMKIAMLVLLRASVPGCTFYVLQLPVGVPPRWHNWIGLIPVLDSSGLEVRNVIGKPAARHIYDAIVPPNHQILLVIGMLGAGKHVDTLVDAWRHDQIRNASLVFVGEAPDDIHALLLRASNEVPSLRYLPGRTNDEDFDQLIEGADAVIALYRYSASSGVVLRALVMGTKVLVGGSTVFVRQLKDVPGVHLVDKVSARTVSASLREVLDLPIVTPMEVDAFDSRFFPTPIVSGVTESEK